MGGDECGTVAALDSARAVFRAGIAAHQGRVVDMAGDSVLAVFDSAAGAVDCALKVQHTLVEASRELAEDCRMLFRIGIHLGDVMEKSDGSVYGDGVNIAARLEGLAEPGGIAVSEPVLLAVRKRVAASFDELGEQRVKNIAEAVRAYRVRPNAVAAPGRRPRAPRPPRRRRALRRRATASTSPRSPCCRSTT